jgi:hypothetical protein
MATTPQAHCHELIKSTAVAMAHEAYAAFMENNHHYSVWKNLWPDGLSGKELEEKWVGKYWGKFIEGARAILAAMLAQPGDEGLKETILEALLLDNSLIRGRKGVSL